MIPELLPRFQPSQANLSLSLMLRSALRSRYEEEESHLPKVEDLRGAAKGLMRLQDVYSLQVSSLVEGRFQRASGGGVIDVCSPAVSVSLSGDDCFLVGKVIHCTEKLILSSSAHILLISALS